MPLPFIKFSLFGMDVLIDNKTGTIQDIVAVAKDSLGLVESMV